MGRPRKPKPPIILTAHDIREGNTVCMHRADTPNLESCMTCSIMYSKRKRIK